MQTILLNIFKFLLLLLVVSQPALARNVCLNLFKPVQKATHTQSVRSYEDIKELIIMSYNTENITQGAGKFLRNEKGELVQVPTKSEEIENGKRSHWKAKIILESNADIIVLQEVESLEALQTFAKTRLKGKYRVEYIQGNDFRINIAFLVKTDLPFLTSLESNRDMRWNDPILNSNVPLFTQRCSSFDASKSRR